MARRSLIAILLCLILAFPVSADNLFSLDFSYSYGNGHFLGGDLVYSATEPFHAYAGFYGRGALPGSAPAGMVGIFAGPGFSIRLGHDLLLQMGAALDIPFGFDNSGDTLRTALGVGILADIGIRWRFNDLLFLSGGIKGGYYFGYFGFDLGNFSFSDEGMMPYHVTPYIGIGIIS